jgi:hypothetical protein
MAARPASHHDAPGLGLRPERGALGVVQARAAAALPAPPEPLLPELGFVDQLVNRVRAAAVVEVAPLGVESPVALAHEVAQDARVRGLARLLVGVGPDQPELTRPVSPERGPTGTP